jgi:hemerythrin-like domain-containing protein
MMPIGPLMVEHRWIERVISDLHRRLNQSSRRTIDPLYVDRLVDFLRSYADRCHHGKEEDILFRDLGAKRLAPALAEIMRELTEEHTWARATTKKLVTANASLAAGHTTALDDVRRLLGELAAFYPEHIRKEDEDFFRPAMTYLTREEQDAMLEEFTGFDASLVHERYRRIAEELEGEALSN